MLHPGEAKEGVVVRDQQVPLARVPNHSPLRGTQGSMLVCLQCGRSPPLRLQSFDCLSLTLPADRAGPFTIQQCIAHAGMEEEVEDVLCEHCSRDRELAELLVPPHGDENVCKLSEEEEKRAFELLSCFSWAEARKLLEHVEEEQRNGLLQNLQRQHHCASEFVPAFPVRHKFAKSLRLVSHPLLLAIHFNRCGQVLNDSVLSLERPRFFSFFLHPFAPHPPYISISFSSSP